ncbi:reverse transcriptase domain-containing protein, partial [Tanacetum coccineum]
ITSTIKYRDVPNSAIKLTLFPFSIKGATQIWLEKEPPRSILTWEDLVSKFINQFFPLSKMINLQNEITNFQQRFEETFSEAWKCLKDLLRACLHHSFMKLHQLDTFYNALTPTDQDSLNAAAGGNLLTKTPRDALTIIENKSKVHNSWNKPVAKKVSTNAPSSSSTSQFPEIAALADAVKALVLQRSPPPASVKAVEEICVTCGGPHPYYQCLSTYGNVFSEYQDNIQGYVSTAAVNYNQGNTGYRPQGTGSLPSNTIANPRGDLKAITTRSGIVLDLTSTDNEDKKISSSNASLILEDYNPPLSDQELPFHIEIPSPELYSHYEASRARGFVLRSLELHILSFIMGIEYPNLID